MSFELKNVPMTIQQAMNVIYRLLSRQHAIMNIDDIKIFSKTQKKQLKLSKDVERVLQDVDVKIKKMKHLYLEKLLSILVMYSPLESYKWRRKTPKRPSYYKT